MSDTTDEDETTDEERSSSDSDIEFREVMEFGVEQVSGELEGIEGEVPQHADRLIVDRANDILRATTDFTIKDEREAIDGPSDDQKKDVLEEAVVDLLLAISALDYEYDLRIADAFERRKEFVEAFKEYEEALQDVETQEEAIEAFEEHMSEYAEEGQIPDAQLGGGPAEVGENVDAEDYDHDDKDRSYA